MTRLFLQSLRLMVIFTVLTGLVYPLVITGIAQIAFRERANGSLLRYEGRAIGSELQAQKFENPKYFQPRPSACDFSTVPSGASNLGPTSSALQSNVFLRAAAFRVSNKIPADAMVPGDMVFTSGSGLDPHISPESTLIQVARIAAVRGIGEDKIKVLVGKYVESPQLGFLGEYRVNVLLLNMALDRL